MAQAVPTTATSSVRSSAPASSTLGYRPRSAEDTVLHQVVVEHLETFLEEARARDGGNGVPGFVERAFRKFIYCGCLARGFARIRCSDCGFEQLVPYSCKVRGLCSSCSGRRMTELSAHLLDSVIPQVPVRQWGLTLPYPVRYMLAWNHERTRAVLAVFNRALEGFYRKKAKQEGILDGRTGSVTAIQTVGSALNLNPHFHTLCLDGVFVREPDGALNFHPVGPITDEEIADLLTTVRHRILRLLKKRGLLDEDDSSFQFDELSDDSPSLAGIYSAGVQGRVAMGQRSGRKVMKIGADPNAPWVTSRTPLQAHLEGFDLHAGVAIGAADPTSRERLERLCRYILRPPVVQDRLELQPDGNILMELKTPFWDGTTHLLYEPLELLEKLTALIPRPRINQVIYSGVLGPNAAWRKEVVGYGFEDRAKDNLKDKPSEVHESDDDENEPATPRRKSYTWAELLARAFLIDVLECPKCSGRMKLISLIDEPRVIRKILDHLGFSTTIPSTAPPRSPPYAEDDETYHVDSWN